MLHLKMILKYLIILYIFGISLCVTSPLENIYFPLQYLIKAFHLMGFLGPVLPYNGLQNAWD